jgi:hypothetical protein
MASKTLGGRGGRYKGVYMREYLNEENIIFDESSHVLIVQQRSKHCTNT